MKIITTPMCEDVLRISGLESFEVVKPTNIDNADVAILLSETKSNIPKIAIKLNTYFQIKESIYKISSEFDTRVNDEKLDYIEKLISDNNEKKDIRKNIKVKVYSNFLRDTVEDMGFSIVDENYDYIVIPDYLKQEFEEEDNLVIIPSHKNVALDAIMRVKQRYDLLERRICMKQ